MLLIQKGKPTKARCCSCEQLFVPSAAVLKSTGGAFLCPACDEVVEENFRRNQIEWKRLDEEQSARAARAERRDRIARRG